MRFDVNEDVGNPIEFREDGSANLMPEQVRIANREVGIHFEVKVDVEAESCFTSETLFDGERARHS
jgi:hypothetical protein